MMLAQRGALDEAKKIFFAGLKSHPDDKRFPTELAGIEFKQHHVSRATTLLRSALRVDPADAYANDFLATVYFLQGNLDAALKYWNKIQKPHINRIQTQPQPRLDPVLLDHAFSSSPASTLLLDELWTSESRIRALDVFPAYRFELIPGDQASFDLTFHSVEENGWGNGKWEGALSLSRGIFQQTIYPEYWNIRRSAINFASLIRWDAQRRRAAAALSGPLQRSPKWRYNFDLDLCNENWRLRSSPVSDAVTLAAFNLEKQSIGIGISSIENWRWQWSTGLEFSHRDFRNVVAPASLAISEISGGNQLKQAGRLDYQILRLPEARFSMAASLRAEIARQFSGNGNLFSKLQGGIGMRWLPKQQGSDYEVNQQLNFGTAAGQPPLDELFVVGLDPDSSLLLRGHLAASGGRKGNTPVGKGYFLSNSEIDKSIYSNGLFTVKIGPFFDAGKILRSGYAYQGNKVLLDVGTQAKMKVLGVGFTFSYGKDLRSGGNVVYLRANHTTLAGQQ